MRRLFNLKENSWVLYRRSIIQLGMWFLIQIYVQYIATCYLNGMI